MIYKIENKVIMKVQWENLEGCRQNIYNYNSTKTMGMPQNIGKDK